MTDRNVTHATFEIVRTYPAPRPRVFAAFADADSKRQWIGPVPGETYELDFRVGGREINVGSMPNGGRFRYEALYHDIVENERIIYSYGADYGAGPMSVSLTTVELADAQDGTRLKYTEQGAYLDGFDGPKYWQNGTASLLDRLGKLLG